MYSLATYLFITEISLTTENNP